MFTSDVLRAIYLGRSLLGSHGSYAHICGKVGYVCVLLGVFLPSWAKKLVSRCWPVWGSLGMRVKITGCECLACLGGEISWQVRVALQDTGHLVVDMFRMLLI